MHRFEVLLTQCNNKCVMKVTESQRLIAGITGRTVTSINKERQSCLTSMMSEIKGLVFSSVNLFICAKRIPQTSNMNKRIFWYYIFIFIHHASCNTCLKQNSSRELPRGLRRRKCKEIKNSFTVTVARSAEESNFFINKSLFCAKSKRLLKSSADIKHN